MSCFGILAIRKMSINMRKSRRIPSPFPWAWSIGCVSKCTERWICSASWSTGEAWEDKRQQSKVTADIHTRNMWTISLTRFLQFPSMEVLRTEVDEAGDNIWMKLVVPYVGTSRYDIQRSTLAWIILKFCGLLLKM